MPAPAFIYHIDKPHPEFETLPPAIADLLELSQSGFPIPKGFIVDPRAFSNYLSLTPLSVKLKHLLHALDPHDHHLISHVSSQIKSLFTNTPLPQDISHSLVQAYDRLSPRHHPVLITTFITTSGSHHPLNITLTSGNANFIESLKSAWSTLYSPVYLSRFSALDSRFQVHSLITLHHDIRSSGLAYTSSPEIHHKHSCIIKAYHGLTYPLDHQLIPDTYHVDKTTRTITSKHIIPQKNQYQYQLSLHQPKLNKVPGLSSLSPKLTDSQILQLSDLSKRLQQHFFFPQIAHWYLSSSRLYIYQVSPLHHQPPEINFPNLSVQSNLKPKTTATGSFAGLVSGPVIYITKLEQLPLSHPHQLIVTNLPLHLINQHRPKCIGIITQYASPIDAILNYSASIQKPLITNLPNALKLFKSNRIYTINGSTGEIFTGGLPQTTISHLN